MSNSDFTPLSPSIFERYERMQALLAECRPALEAAVRGDVQPAAKCLLHPGWGDVQVDGSNNERATK